MGAQVANEALPALHELVAQGFARHIGVTGLPLQTLSNLLARVPDKHAPALVLSYCHFCLNDSALLDRIADFEARGVGVINASCLAMGLLTRQGPPEWHPAPEEVQAAAKRAVEAADSHGADIARLALGYAVRVRCCWLCCTVIRHSFLCARSVYCVYCVTRVVCMAAVCAVCVM